MTDFADFPRPGENYPYEEPDDPVQVRADDPLHKLERQTGGTFASYLSFSFTYHSHLWNLWTTMWFVSDLQIYQFMSTHSRKKKTF